MLQKSVKGLMVLGIRKQAGEKLSMKILENQSQTIQRDK